MTWQKAPRPRAAGHRKSKRQLDADIAAALAKRSAAKTQRAHASKASPSRSPKERLVALLMERTDEARDVARDLLLEHGVIKTGRIESMRFIGDSHLGVVYEVSVVMNEGGRLKRFWMLDPEGDPDMAAVGEHVDFTSTDDYPPTSFTGENIVLPKQQLHSVSGLRAPWPESAIRKWVQRWWR